MKVVFRPDASGIREVLSSAAVRDATYAKAQEIAAKANAMAGNGEPADHPAYTAHRGENSNVGIANVSTSSRHGANDNSAHHTLQKAGGV